MFLFTYFSFLNNITVKAGQKFVFNLFNFEKLNKSAVINQI